jgi:hypothetical protein
MIGKRYGRLVVLSTINTNRFLCRCDCGNEGIATRSNLRNGNSQSCGCLQKERAAVAGLNNFVDISGKRFGRLIVLRAVESKQAKEMVMQM